MEKKSKEELQAAAERRKKFKADNEAYYAKKREEKKKEDEEFEVWKTEQGLNRESYDEGKHGSIHHRCSEAVLRALFVAKYVRPIDFNSEDRYFSVVIIPSPFKDTVWSAQEIHIRCDRLNGAQFDHLCAVKLRASGSEPDDDDIPDRKRIELWFATKDMKETLENVEVDPSISHPNEISIFSDESTEENEKDPCCVLFGWLNSGCPSIVLRPGYSVIIQSAFEY